MFVTLHTFHALESDHAVSSDLLGLGEREREKKTWYLSLGWVGQTFSQKMG